MSDKQNDLAFVDEVEARANAATPGPWRECWDDPPHPTFGEHTAVVSAVDGLPLGGIVVGSLWYDGMNAACRKNDAVFIANARTDVPKLIAIVRERDAQIETLQENLAAIEQSTGELCTLCGWAMKFPDAPCRCELETERDALRAQRQDVIDGMTRAVTAEGAANKAYYEVCAERDKLRSRVAKLEEAAAFVYNAVLVSSVCDEPCDCIDCQILETLGEALDIPRIGET